MVLADLIVLSRNGNWWCVLQLTPGVGLKMNVRAAVVLRKSKGSRGNQNRIPQGRKTRVNDLEDIG
jgi:hypothetical protein